MSHVNAVVPRFDLGGRARLLLVVFAVSVAALFYGRASAQRDPTLGAKCQAWYQKALSGKWFTKQEGSAFAATEDIQETSGSVLGCREFFQLQRTCQNADVAFLEAGGVAGSAAAGRLLRTIESVSGCKSIIGAGDVCLVVRAAGRSGNLSPKLQSILRECSDEGIASRTSSMLRPAV
jgi:hypothetical protein